MNRGFSLTHQSRSTGRNVPQIFMIWLVALATLLSTQAMAQSSLPRSITETSSDLTGEQLGQIGSFIDRWIEVLTLPESTAQEIQRARRALANRDMLNPPNGFSIKFRQQYSNMLEPKLESILAGDNQRAAIDALLIASRLGTDDALQLVIDQIKSDSAAIRTAAAGRAILAMTDIPLKRSLIVPPKVSELARETSEQAMIESSPYALQRQLELLHAIELTALLEGNQYRQIAGDVHRMQLRVLGAQAESLQSAEVDAITMMIGRLRRTYQQADNSVQKTEGPILASHLKKLLNSVDENWEAADADRQTLAAYERLIEDSESFLIFIDSSIARPNATPSTKLKQHWVDRDKPKFDADREIWNEHLTQPPYNAGR